MNHGEVLGLLHSRIVKAGTLDEAKKWGLVLWIMMARTKEGLRCASCHLRADGYEDERPPVEEVNQPQP